MSTASPYALTRQDLDRIRNADLIFGTAKLLPSASQIPDEFRAGNLYTQLAESLFFKRPLPNANIVFKPGFDDPAAPGALHKCVQAHMVGRRRLKHGRKLAAVGFMLAQVCELRPI